MTLAARTLSYGFPNRTVGQGVDLEKHLNKRVDVYGVVRTGTTKPYVIATAVEQP